MNKTALFFLTLLPVFAFGQTQNYSSALPPDVIELRVEANTASYNIDYATARAKYEEIRKRLPHHPAGDLYLAMVTWLEHLYKSRRLQTGLYRDQSSFYAGADGQRPSLLKATARSGPNNRPCFVSDCKTRCARTPTMLERAESPSRADPRANL